MKTLLASNSTVTSTVVPFLKGQGIALHGWTSIEVIFANLEPGLVEMEICEQINMQKFSDKDINVPLR